MKDHPSATRRVISLAVMLIVLLIIAAGVWFVVQGTANRQSAQVSPAPASSGAPTGQAASEQTAAPGETTHPEQTRASQPAGPTGTHAPGGATLQVSASDTAQPTPSVAPAAVTEVTTEISVQPTANPTQKPGGGGISPTSKPASTKPAPTPSTPTATLAPTVVPTYAVGAAAIGVGTNIGSGQARVVSVTRPGTNQIVSLGGTAPQPPAKNSWVLVELLEICNGTANCSPDLSAMRVVGTSGAFYSPGNGFVMDPIFGPTAYVHGQVWGYMGFIVPDSEAQMWLIITIGGKNYPFALQ